MRTWYVFALTRSDIYLSRANVCDFTNRALVSSTDFTGTPCTFVFSILAFDATALYFPRA